jgi:twitching motility protein PilT
MNKIEQVLKYAQSKNATDIHMCAGAPIFFRLKQELVAGTEEKLTATQVKELVFGLLSDKQRFEFEKELDYDLMFRDKNGRYRINIGLFNGSVGATIRILPCEPRTIENLFLPDVVKSLAHRTKGLVLITGSTSQGKTTTMASMIDEINKTCRKHIITIEDPIEYVHTSKKGIVRQRCVGKDTQTFCSGLRAALRQDPDVIAIGEMRDFDTIRIALSAAETGTLVLSTLHVISIDKVMERLLSYAPVEGENNFRFLLAESLQGVVHQELFPTIDGGQRVACEILVGTTAVRNIIRRNNGVLLRGVMETGKKHGMLTMQESIEKFQEEGIISEDIAKNILTSYNRF